MRPSLLSSWIAISTLIPSALALVQDQSAPLQLRSVNCTDVRAPTDASCWETLNLSAWLTNWNQTTPTCREDQDGADCCLVGEAWNKCFLRLAHGASGSDCTEINAQACSWTQYLNVERDIAPQVFYVMTNIYALNNFFTNWYLALQFASAQAALIIPSLITLVDPDKTTNFDLGEALTALSAGFAFLALPEISAAAFGIEEVTVTAAKALIAGLQQAPGVGKAIWPTGTVSSRMVQIGDMATTLGQIDSDAGNMINEGMTLLMTDVPSFVKFASTGAWSSGTPFSLPSTVQGLDLGLKTFLVSTAMGNNLKPYTVVGPKCNVTLVASAYSDPVNSLTPVGCIRESSLQNSDSLAVGIVLGCDANNICTWPGLKREFWHSPALNHAYLLNGVDDNYLATIVSNGWTQLDLLFDGAFRCAASGNFDTGSPINFAGDGTVDTTCMSKLLECFATEDCPIALVNGVCPYTACPDWPF